MNNEKPSINQSTFFVDPIEWEQDVFEICNQTDGLIDKEQMEFVIGITYDILDILISRNCFYWKRRIPRNIKQKLGWVVDKQNSLQRMVW